MHAAAVGEIAIVKSVEMEQAVHQIKPELVREGSPVGLRLPLRRLDADADLAMFERDDVCRPIDLQEAAVEFVRVARADGKL